MGPAEIVASLKELCAAKGPRLTTDQIVSWIDVHGGYGSDAELIAFAKKMKARQMARLLEFEDEESGLRVKRLWSFYDRARRERFYVDITELPDERRRALIAQYARFVEEMRTVRRAMLDYFAGQQFFDFYPGGPTLNEDDVRDPSIASDRAPRPARPARGQQPRA